MSLSLEQKSLYLVPFDRTQIERSIAKTLNADELRDFKIAVFREVGKLTDRMDSGELSEEDIVDSVDALSSQFRVSAGHAQKPINVILKHHFYLTRGWDARTKTALHCPIDSVVFEKLGKRQMSLISLDMDKYLQLQSEIAEKGPARLDFDRALDEQNLQFWGIL